MTLLDWSGSYSVGIKALDDEHKALIALMNELYRHVIGGTASEASAREALLQLEAHAKQHFAREEGLLEQYGYPNLGEHKRQHQQFFGEVEKFQRSLNLGSASPDIVRFLLEWVLRHILKDDRRYHEFLKSKGVH